MRGYICETRDTNDTTSHYESICPQDMIDYGSSCYWMIKEPSTAEDAERSCRKENGHLVEVNNKYELSFIKSFILMNFGNYWLGLKRHNDTFDWNSGAVFDLEEVYWAAGTEDLNIGSCVLAFIDTIPDPYGGENVLWTPKNCSNLYFGICEREKTFYPKPKMPSTPMVPSCPPPFSIVNDKNDTCYWVSPLEFVLSWNQSRQYCQSLGGELLSFVDSEEDTFVYRYLSVDPRGYWIGLKFEADTKEFEWSDGSSYAYTHWTEGQPDNANFRRFCVSLTTQKLTWAMSYCGSQKRFICKGSKIIIPKDRRPPPTIEPLISCGGQYKEWTYFDGRCYFVWINSQTWHKAKQYCESVGGSLVSIQSDRETDFLLRLFASRKLASNRVWIGLSSLGFDGSLEWADSSEVNYVNWYSGEPNNLMNQEKCCNMYVSSGMWNDENCNSKMDFVCERYNGTTTKYSSTLSTPLPGNCPVGFRSYGNKCYLLIGDKENERETWPNALKKCSVLADQLASVHSVEEQNFLSSLLVYHRVNAWIGLHDLIQDTDFFWADNTPLDFTYWAPNEPQSFSHREDCVEMMFDSINMGKWNDAMCDDKKAFFCQRYKDPSISTPAPDVTTCSNPEGWKRLDSTCYKLFYSPLKRITWPQAEIVCSRYGGHLATVRDVTIQTFLKFYIMEASIPTWIGLRENKEKRFEWISGWPLTYTDWSKGQPLSSQRGHSCVVMLKGGHWKTSNCRERRPFVCEISSDIPATLPVQIEGFCPRQAVEWQDLGGPNCYLFETEKLLSWPKANLKCLQHGGSLISIHSQHELSVMSMYLKQSKNSVWLGLVRMHDGGFSWSDQSPVDFVKWANEEPSNLKEHCVEMYSDTMEWNDLECAFRRGYVCMMAKVPLNETQNLQQHSESDSLVDHTLSSGGIVGVVIGCLIPVILLISVSIIYVRRQIIKEPPLVTNPRSEPMSFENALFAGNPDLDELDETFKS